MSQTIVSSITNDNSTSTEDPFSNDDSNFTITDQLTSTSSPEVFGTSPLLLTTTEDPCLNFTEQLSNSSLNGRDLNSSSPDATLLDNEHLMQLCKQKKRDITRTGISTPSLIGVIVGAVILATFTIGLIFYFVYRKKHEKRKRQANAFVVNSYISGSLNTESGHCNLTVSEINDIDDLTSLDNDSFLHSLESAVFSNYQRRHPQHASSTNLNNNNSDDVSSNCSSSGKSSQDMLHQLPTLQTSSGSPKMSSTSRTLPLQQGISLKPHLQSNKNQLRSHTRMSVSSGSTTSTTLYPVPELTLSTIITTNHRHGSSHQRYMPAPSETTSSSGPTLDKTKDSKHLSLTDEAISSVKQSPL